MACGTWFLTSPALHIASGNMTSLQESVDCGGCSSRIDSVQCVACCHPQWREMCHGALAEMKRSVVACGGGGGDGGHLSLTSISQSFMSLYWVAPLFYSHPHVLYFKAPSCLSLCSFLHSPHIVDRTSQWELLSQECTGWDNSHSSFCIAYCHCFLYQFPKEIGPKTTDIFIIIIFHCDNFFTEASTVLRYNILWTLKVRSCNTCSFLAVTDLLFT